MKETGTIADFSGIVIEMSVIGIVIIRMDHNLTRVLGCLLYILRL